jgi:hypothetical protein
LLQRRLWLSGVSRESLINANDDRPKFVLPLLKALVCEAYTYPDLTSNGSARHGNQKRIVDGRRPAVSTSTRCPEPFQLCTPGSRPFVLHVHLGVEHAPPRVLHLPAPAPPFCLRAPTFARRSIARLRNCVHCILVHSARVPRLLVVSACSRFCLRAERILRPNA